MQYELLVKGDMVGDVILINPEKLQRAEEIFKFIEPKLQGKQKQVIAVAGPSGSGKSETASLLATMFQKKGKKSYVISCDNYAIRPPRDNEKHREELYEEGREDSLERYLGQSDEILFSRLSSLVESFKDGGEELQLRFIDNPNNVILHEEKAVDFSGIEVLVLEGTWSCKVTEAHFRLFLETDYKATLAHREARGRDPLTPFGETVLAIEQAKLNDLKRDADFVVDIEGKVVPPIDDWEKHRAFLQDQSPHILMVTNHGVHEFEVIAGLPDTGGQNVFVNQFSDALVNLGFRVTTANRGGFMHPQRERRQRGISYRSEKERILYVEDDKAEFIRKEDMESQVDTIAQNLAKFLKEEGTPIAAIISHYWDGAAVAAKVQNALAQEQDSSAAEMPHIWVPHSLGTIKKRNMEKSQWANLRVDERIAIEEKVIPQCRAIGATSTAISKALIADYGYKKEQLFLPPCIDTKRFFPQEVAIDAPVWDLLAEMSGSEKEGLKERLIISEVSRTDKTKRKDVLIKAFAQVHKTFPQTFLAVTIDDTRRELYDSLVDLVKELGLEGQVAILGSIWETIPDLYRVSDIYCTPSVMEGFGMSIQEAAACQTPAVSSDLVPFAVEYLRGQEFKKVDEMHVGPGAIICPADDVASFAQALSLLVGDEAMRKQMGEAALAITIPYFTWDGMTREFLAGAGVALPKGE